MRGGKEVFFFKSPKSLCAIRNSLFAIRSSLLPHQSRLLTLPVALFFGFALVVEFLAARDAELAFGDAFRGEIEPERNERHAFALNRDGEPLRLALVHQQLARA